jgi:hypothetical protein
MSPRVACSWLLATTALATTLHLVAGVVPCGVFVGRRECASVVGLQVPQAGLDTPAFNATVEAKAAVMLAGMAGGDALRKPCGTYSGRCCRAMRQLACRMAVAEAARELTPSIPLEATLACDALTPTTAFAACNSST